MHVRVLKSHRIQGRLLSPQLIPPEVACVHRLCPEVAPDPLGHAPCKRARWICSDSAQPTLMGTDVFLIAKTCYRAHFPARIEMGSVGSLPNTAIHIWLMCSFLEEWGKESHAAAFDKTVHAASLIEASQVAGAAALVHAGTMQRGSCPNM